MLYSAVRVNYRLNSQTAFFVEDKQTPDVVCREIKMCHGLEQCRLWPVPKGAGAGAGAGGVRAPATGANPYANWERLGPEGHAKWRHMVETAVRACVVVGVVRCVWLRAGGNCTECPL
jgi:hypothetical protein